MITSAERLLSSNPFIRLLYQKENIKSKNLFKRLSYIKKLNKFKKSTYYSSPSLDMLWHMADFIKFAEDAFLYNNSIDNKEIGLYSSRKYKSWENGFKLQNDDFNIILKINKKDSTIGIVITDNTQDPKEKVLWFKDNDWMYGSDITIENEILLDMVIDKINYCIFLLFDDCYYKRLRREYYDDNNLGCIL